MQKLSEYVQENEALRQLNKESRKILTFLIPTLLFSRVTSAEVSAETAFVFNTFLFVFSGVLVMFMALGLHVRSWIVRKKNTSAILLKNIALYSIAGIMFYLIGYSLMYVDVSGWIGSLGGVFTILLMI